MFELCDEGVWVEVLIIALLLCDGRYFAEFELRDDDKPFGFGFDELP